MESLDLMIASLSNSTLKQYEVSLKQWWSFCQMKGTNPYEVQRDNRMEFLSKKFKEGSSYSSLNSFRSAVSLISTNEVGEDPRVVRLMKGIYKSALSRPRYDTVWDTNEVLNTLEGWSPADTLTLKMLSQKTIMLLALSTGPGNPSHY